MLAVQDLVVWMVVLGSSVYAAWVLMPGAWRRGLATRLLHLPSPAWLRAPLQQAVASGAGCDCSGCDKAVGLKAAVRTVPTEAPVQVVRFHPPRKT